MPVFSWAWAACAACGSSWTCRAAAVAGLGVVIAVGLALGFLAGGHFSPCNPRNLDRCGRRLSSTLQVLDAAGGDGGPAPEQDAAALCPSLAEAVDCFFWFSQRCLPLREQHFYSKVYVEASGVVQGLCGADRGSDPPLLVSHGACLGAARTRRAECTGLFAEQVRQGHSADGTVSAQSTVPVIDSLYLYDAGAEGTFQGPLCRALREYILCGLHLVSDTCGLPVALHIQDIHDNLTSLVFSSKCDAGLRPVLPGPVVALPSVDLMTAAPGTLTLTLVSFIALLIPVCIALVRRLLSSKSQERRQDTEKSAGL